MSTAVDQSATLIAPDGFPLAIIIVSSMFCVLSIIAVAIRTYVRSSERTFGWDDGLMVAGAIVYVADSALLIYGCLIGLGRLDATLNAWQFANSIKYYITWVAIYVVSLVLVKSSVCITILRIVSSRPYLKYVVWVLLAISWASFFITFIGTLLYCRPIQALWTPTMLLSGEGTCASTSVLIALGQVATSTSIVTDFSMVVVPAIVLWKAQMKRAAKIQGFTLLSFASAASIITIARIPYVNRFGAGVNLPFWLAHIALCSNIEIGIGCIAPAAPAILRLFGVTGRQKHTKNTSDPTHALGEEYSHQRSKTGGSTGTKFRNPTDLGFNFTTVSHGSRAGMGERDQWERLQEDGESDKGRLLHANGDIKGMSIEQSYEVNIEMKDRV